MENGYTEMRARRGLQGRCRQISLKFSLLALLSVVTFGLGTNAAVAGETHLLVNGKAIHLNPPAGKNLNESNWGLGLQYDGGLIDKKYVPFATVSGFKDSNRNASYYAGGGMLRRFQGDSAHFDVGAIAFVMVRKNYKNGEPFLGVLPAFTVGTERVSVNMSYVPKVDPKAVPLWFFQLKIRL